MEQIEGGIDKDREERKGRRKGLTQTPLRGLVLSRQRRQGERTLQRGVQAAVRDAGSSEHIATPQQQHSQQSTVESWKKEMCMLEPKMLKIVK